MADDNNVVPTLDISGSFVEDVYAIGNTILNRKNNPPPFLVFPSGTRVSVPNASLQDLHQRFVGAAQNKFPSIGLNAANTWFTLKAGIVKGSYTTHLNRYTDLWNGGKGGTDSGTTIPVASCGRNSFRPRDFTGIPRSPLWFCHRQSRRPAI